MDDKLQKAAHERLERIRARNKGILAPDDVVRDAHSESSPLHSYFTWDNTEAAHQYRLEQARTLIRNVKVTVTTSSERIAAPYYIRDPRVASSEQGYGSLAEIRDESAVASEALRYEFDRAIGSFERAVCIAGALGLSAQVDDLLRMTREVKGAIPIVASKPRTAKGARVPQKSAARKLAKTA